MSQLAQSCWNLRDVGPLRVSRADLTFDRNYDPLATKRTIRINCYTWILTGVTDESYRRWIIIYEPR